MNVGELENFKLMEEPVSITTSEIEEKEENGEKFHIRKIRTARKGTYGFMCGRCFNLVFKYENYDVTTNITVSDESKDWVNPDTFGITHKLECPNCQINHKNWIELDPNIALIISNLNKVGIYTEFCCEGHIRYDETENDVDYCTPYVYFTKDGHKIIQRYLKYLPPTWYVDLDYYKKDMMIIRSTPDVSKKEALFDLHRYVNTIANKLEPMVKNLKSMFPDWFIDDCIRKKFIL